MELLKATRPFNQHRESPSFIHDIDAILAADLPSHEALRDIWLHLTQDLPCYATWMYVYHLHKYHLDAKQRGPVFIHMRQLLSSSQTSLWKELCYSLWVDFFEDKETVTETWNALTPETLDTTSLERLLPFTGPVPYDLKRTLYHTLVIDKKFHTSLFEALNASAFDVYGQIDKADALQLLDPLKPHADADKFQRLTEKLAR